MAHPRLRLRASNCNLLLIYLTKKDERLSWPGGLTYSGRFTHSSATGRAQDRESLPAKDQHSTNVPRNQPTNWSYDVEIMFVVCYSHDHYTITRCSLQTFKTSSTNNNNINLIWQSQLQCNIGKKSAQLSVEMLQSLTTSATYFFDNPLLPPVQRNDTA